MKFLAFTDIHEDKKAVKALVKRAMEDDIDFIVSTGDISNFGSGLRFNIKSFATLGKKFYVIPGNHEETGSMLDDVTKDFPDCINLNRKVAQVGDYFFLGFGGDGFSLQDPEFRKISREWYGKYKDKKIVLLTHGPPFGTKLDFVSGSHVGNKDYTKFIQRIKPKIAISGHLHETVGAKDKIGKTALINPGWDGMVIELK